jgi:transcriptional regulator with XRE-family HTH domain
MPQALNLKKERLNKGLTQKQLAEKIGTKKQSISNWEKGVSVPHYNKLKKLEEILEESIEYLLKPIET